jgi:hypothetical protein
MKKTNEFRVVSLLFRDEKFRIKIIKGGNNKITAINDDQIEKIIKINDYGA